MLKQLIESDKLPIWVLNLERSPERRAFMAGQFSRLSLDYEIISAVDGLKLTIDELERYSKIDAMRCSERELLPGEIGCALSHARIWQKIVDENIEQVLVFEDDIMIGEMMFKVLEELHMLPVDWEFINFATNAGRIPFGEPVYDIYRICRFTCFANCTGAYLINNSGARKLLNHVYPIRWTADGLTGNSYITGLVAYGVDPLVVAQLNCHSDIHIDASYSKLPRSFKAKMRTIFRKYINIQEFLFNKCFKVQK